MARILLVDADSANGFPNLALMKLSAWHKKKGDEVTFLKGIPSTAPLNTPDKTYISCIYHQNRKAVADFALQIDGALEVGGSGWDLKLDLPEEVEHIMPDYDLYGTDFSMGFASRGCLRRCAFCVVPRKEGRVRDNAPISEFLHPDHDKLILLDNNFLASPGCIENLREIIERGLKVNFNQGLDIRLLTKEKAFLLKETKAYDWSFKKKKLHFAFDSPKYEKAVKRGIDLLKKVGLSRIQLREHIIFYVLVGHKTTPQEDLDRVRKLIEWGVGPYIMRFDKAEGPHRILMHLARWVNRKFYQHFDFCDYDYSDSKAAYRAVFGIHPDPTWPGYSCPQGGYAWASRNIDEQTEEIIQVQLDLGETEEEVG